MARFVFSCSVFIRAGCTLWRESWVLVVDSSLFAWMRTFIAASFPVVEVWCRRIKDITYFFRMSSLTFFLTAFTRLPRPSLVQRLASLAHDEVNQDECS